jgi:hypothetical protein
VKPQQRGKRRVHGGALARREIAREELEVERRCAHG